MTEGSPLRRKEFLQPAELTGIFVPTVTPFIEINGKRRLDWASHYKHIANLARRGTGVSGIFLGSNAGEARDMSMTDLKLSILSGIMAVRKKNKDLPVVVGAIRKSIAEVLEIAKFAEDNGADAVVLTPGYTTSGMDRLLYAVSEYTKLPIIIYNNPGFQIDQNGNSFNLPKEFLQEALKDPRVIGIKDTSSEENGDMRYFEELHRICKNQDHQVQLMQGNTLAALYPSIRKADGMVPMEANLFSEIIKDVLDPNKTYLNARSELIKMFGLINSFRSIYHGSSRYIKHILHEHEIFETELMYEDLKSK